MKNRDYWRRRFEILEASAVNKGQNYLATLDREYMTAMKNVEAELSTWYQRFAGNNAITLAEAKQWLNKGQLAEFKWSVEDYIKYGQENALNQQWMKQLENASAKVHVSRLQALQLEMQQKIEALYGNQLDGIDALARKIYTEGYYHTAFEVQKGFNIGWDLTPLNQKQLDSVISKPWTLDKETFSDRIWKQKNALVGKVQTEMTQTLLRGDSPDKAIKAISKQFNVSKSQAGRLVMTESAYFASEAQKDCFNGLDVERFEIVATLDSHTSELCQSLDGHIEEMKNYEAGVTAPPFHPWCRTTTVPYFEDNAGLRAARGADGKTYYVPSDMKYKDWKKTFVDGGEKAGLKDIPKDDILKGVHDRLSKQNFTETQIKEVQDYVSKLDGDEQKRWADAIKSTKYDIGDESVSAHYSPNNHTVYLANSDNAETIFHETAHALDEGSVHKVMFEGESYEFTINKASKYLQERMDYDTRDADFVSFCKAIGAKVNEDGSWFGEEGFEVFQKYNAWAKETVKAYGKMGFDSVSDIFSGITQDEIGASLLWGGHSKDYWQRPVTGNMAFMSYTEAWADFSTLKATKNEPMLSLLKEIIPNQYKILEEIYSEVFK